MLCTDQAEGKCLSNVSGRSGSISTVIKTSRAPCDSTTTINCPSGYTVLGGGIAALESGGTCNGQSGDIEWIVSYPQGNGWRCGANDYRPICYVVCEKL